MRNLFLFILGLSLFACTNPDANKNDEKTDGIYTVDELKSSFAEHVGEEVTVKGIVNHVCTHGGTKMFIQGDEANIKIMAGESGNFTADEVMYNEVSVTGIVDEFVINKDYIMQLEADLEADIAEGKFEGEDAPEANPEHENLDAGAHIEETGERHNALEERKAEIENVKKMLEESGKESLSFYSVVASSYEILEVLPKPENAKEGGCGDEDTTEKDDEGCEGDEDHDHDHNHDHDHDHDHNHDAKEDGEGC